MFVESHTQVAAAQRAPIFAEDVWGGAIFIEAIRSATGPEHQRRHVESSPTPSGRQALMTH
jgi:hypothetical protein